MSHEEVAAAGRDLARRYAQAVDGDATDILAGVELAIFEGWEAAHMGHRGVAGMPNREMPQLRQANPTMPQAVSLLQAVLSDPAYGLARLAPAGKRASIAQRLAVLLDRAGRGDAPTWLSWGLVSGSARKISDENADPVAAGFAELAELFVVDDHSDGPHGARRLVEAAVVAHADAISEREAPAPENALAVRQSAALDYLTWLIGLVNGIDSNS